MFEERVGLMKNTLLPAIPTISRPTFLNTPFFILLGLEKNTSTSCSVNSLDLIVLFDKSSMVTTSAYLGSAPPGFPSTLCIYEQFLKDIYLRLLRLLFY